MLDFFKKMLGNKSQRDIKVINPVLDKALAAWEEIKNVSNDELRARTVAFKHRIREHLADKEKEIEDLKEQLNSDDIEIDEKENMYGVLDKLEKESYELTQEVLNEILPEARQHVGSLLLCAGKGFGCELQCHPQDFFRYFHFHRLNLEHHQ